MSERALQTFLHLPEDVLSPRPRSRSPRGDRGYVADVGVGSADPIPMNPGAAAGLIAPIDQDGEATMPLAV